MFSVKCPEKNVMLHKNKNNFNDHLYNFKLDKMSLFEVRMVKIDNILPVASSYL